MGRLNTLVKMIVAMVLTIVTISCEKDNGGSGIDSVINVTGKKLLTVQSAASEFEVGYSVTGSSAGQAVTTVSDKDWLTVDASAPGTVSVAVSANLSSEDREAVITLSLKGAEDAYLTVLQSSDPDYRIDSKMSFDLAVTDIESSSAFVSVAPNTDSYYCYGVVTAENYAKFNGDGKAFVADYAKQLIEYARKQAESSGSTMSLANYLSKGYKSHSYNGFEPLSDYYLFAFDMTLGGEYSGRLAVKKFTTKKYPDSAPDFTITVDKDAKVKVVPADGSVTYVLTVDSKTVWESYTTPKACAEDFLKWVEDSDDYSIRDFMHQGEYTALYYNPKAQTGNLTTGDYVAYAFGYNGTKITTGISYLRFHFDEPQ